METKEEVKDVPLDVLADRYASAAMVDIFGGKTKIRLKRKLWVAILKAQAEAGVAIPPEAIAAYESRIDTIDLESIRKREKKSRHEELAQIEEFNELAGYQLIHLGLTSRDASDNLEQLQIRTALKLVHQRTIALLDRLAKKAAEFKLLDICGRSHFVPGQTTTLGKRFATFAEELLKAHVLLEYSLFTYPLRGIKGPMGTQQDIADVLENLEAPEKTAEKVAKLEERIQRELGFSRMFISTGQVYSRALDFAVVGLLIQLASPASNFAMMVRLSAGLGLMHEGAQQGGSSAMPHKINSRTCERINGLMDVLGGFHAMLRCLVGKQWLEGDVSCSVVRRVAIPGAFFAFDGIYESAMTVLDEMKVFPVVIDRELKENLLLLSTTRILMAAVKKGAGREDAHAAIQKHVRTAVSLARETNAEIPLIEWLADDERLMLSHDEITALVKEPEHGLAVEQVEKVCREVAYAVAQYPEAAKYVPEKIV